jgi:hypothetical protein
MRRLVWMIPVIGMIVAATPVQAQTYDPNYPICLQTYGIAGNYIACRYTAMGQCQLAASGRAAQCITNPYFGRVYRRPHRVY